MSKFRRPDKITNYWSEMLPTSLPPCFYTAGLLAHSFINKESITTNRKAMV